MTSYKIAIVKRGMEALWRDYWISSDAASTEERAPNELGRTRVVEATSLDEAIELVKREHPDCTVMLAGGEHHVA
jgi:hypothetical protein